MTLTLIPGLTGFAVAGAGDTLRRGLVVIAWLVCALIAIVLTGGGASPLIVLLVAAPLAALLAGAPRMAAEAGTFAALALFAVFVATPAGWIPPPPRGALELAAPFAFAGLVLAALKIWHLVSQRGAAPPAELPKGEPDPQPIAMTGISWIDVTPEGRLRRVQGDTFGLVTMRPGSALGSLFTDHDFPLPPPGRFCCSGCGGERRGCSSAIRRPTQSITPLQRPGCRQRTVDHLQPHRSLQGR